MPQTTRSHPLFVFAHGAGAGSQSEWMRSWAERLRSLGTVVPFDYPYMAAGKRAPNRLPVLLERHREVLNTARSTHLAAHPIVLVGKSMGSRVGCHLSLEAAVDGVICLGYPLRSSGKKKTVRSDVLVAMNVPVLFCQGTRDPMGPLDLFDDVRSRMVAPSLLHVVEGGDHSLRVGVRALKARGLSQEDVDEMTVSAIRSFVTTLAPL